MHSYEPQAIERKWQARWEAENSFRTPNPGDPDFDPSKPKFYVLDMFPYPSGSGLHVGHPLGYIGSDIIARKMRMEGHNVLHPMGYDAFGLPAEQFAITTGKHPAETTKQNIETFRRQLKMIGLSYDWSREVSTCDPEYYKWTQWIFTRLFDKGLAYQAMVPVWWCDALKTVLANEEVINGRSERGDHPCERRPLKQWMLKITEYADRLIDDLDKVEWPESVKTMQREWIGRSRGAEVAFPVQGEVVEPLVVFTTRPDTIFGATFMVISPEHPLLKKLTTPDQRETVEDYVKAALLKTDLERTDLAKEKTGVFTGSYCLNPLMDGSNPKARIPIYVGDYVLISYGHGAIMAVPGHDERDFEFAQKYGLSVIEVVRPPRGAKGLDEGECYTGAGTAVNSLPINGLLTPHAKEKVIEMLSQRGMGAAKTTYRLRDWLFSRQRYWGEPFPILHHENGEIDRVPDDHLPVTLPEMSDFSPSADGAAPLNRVPEWVQTTDPATGRPSLRETDTMPGWAGSCWYYLRFMDPQNADEGWSKAAEEYWQNVDLYVGGVEHAVLHLLYARFWHKVLFDVGAVSTEEPFQRLFNQGMLTAFAYKDETGRLVPSDKVDVRGEDSFLHLETQKPVERVIAKMSKSLKNVVNPDSVIDQYGCDTFRLYEMFMGPLAESKPWNPRDVPGCRRFLERVWRIIVGEEGESPVRPALLKAAEDKPSGASEELERSWNKALKRMDDSFKNFNFNTGIAGLMTFMNDASRQPEALTRSQAERFVLTLSPFAPHLCEELWERLGHQGGILHAPWPEVDEHYLEEDDFELIVQVLGKLRGRTRAPKSATKDELEQIAREVVAAQLEGKDVVKTIIVPGRLVNFVVKK